MDRPSRCSGCARSQGKRRRSGAGFWVRRQPKAAYPSGGERALDKAMGELAKHPIRYCAVVGAFFPDVTRHAIESALADPGAEEDLRELIRKLESPHRDQKRSLPSAPAMERRSRRSEQAQPPCCAPPKQSSSKHRPATWAWRCHARERPCRPGINDPTQRPTLLDAGCSYFMPGHNSESGMAHQAVRHRAFRIALCR